MSQILAYGENVIKRGSNIAVFHFFLSSSQPVFSTSGAGVAFFLYRHGNVKNTDENSKNYFEFRHT